MKTHERQKNSKKSFQKIGRTVTLFIDFRELKQLCKQLEFSSNFWKYIRFRTHAHKTHHFRYHRFFNLVR